jgi:hypothetical protein
MYIYVRSHASYIGANGLKYVKIGKASNIPERDATYATGELNRGHFTHIYEVPAKLLNIVDNLIKDNFKTRNYRLDGGTEFYEPETADLIKPFIDSLQIPCKLLTVAEIASLTRSKRVREKWKTAIVRTVKLCGVMPRPYQCEIIGRAVNCLNGDGRGVLVLPCGVGKTFIALFIARELLGLDAFLIVGVPNILVQEQWRDAIKKFGFNAIVTTYHSAYKYGHIANVGMLIMDEVHHVVNSAAGSSPRDFSEILNISARFQLSITATLPKCDSAIFGQIIDSRPVSWAIEQNIICDYLIYVIKYYDACPSVLNYAVAAAEWQFNNESINKMVIYANSRENAKTIADLLNCKIQCENYDGAMSKARRCDIMQRFKTANRAALVCVYCLGEGWDFPDLDAVLFAENMTSEVRIIQAALRASRKNNLKPDKIAKIIIPLIDEFKTIFEVIKQMSGEDVNIINKIRGFNATGLVGDKMEYSLCATFTETIKMHVLSRLDLVEFTYERARDALVKYQFKSAAEYQAAILTEPALIRHPHEPAAVFAEFKNWADYLSLNAEGAASAATIAAAFRELQSLGSVHRFMDFKEIICLISSRIDRCPPIEFIETVYGIRNKYDLLNF